jgi:flagellar hook-basal body complex protein FliE
MSEISPLQLHDEMSRLRALAQAERGQPIDNINQSDGDSFGSLLRQQIDEVNVMKQQSQSLAQAFELGDPNVSLVDVMIASQKSSVSFSALTEVRNKLLGAYQEIMGMSV